MVGHIPFADPFDKQLSAVVVKAVGREGVLEGHGVKLHEKGTIVCIGNVFLSVSLDTILGRKPFTAPISKNNADNGMSI